jgi:hypothetical protein
MGSAVSCFEIKMLHFMALVQWSMENEKGGISLKCIWTMLVESMKKHHLRESYRELVNVDRIAS